MLSAPFSRNIMPPAAEHPDGSRPLRRADLDTCTDLHLHQTIFCATLDYSTLKAPAWMMCTVAPSAATLCCQLPFVALPPPPVGSPPHRAMEHIPRLLAVKRGAALPYRHLAVATPSIDCKLE